MYLYFHLHLYLRRVALCFEKSAGTAIHLQRNESGMVSQDKTKTRRETDLAEPRLNEAES